jgi:hypothetical protein
MFDSKANRYRQNGTFVSCVVGLASIARQSKQRRSPRSGEAEAVDWELLTFQGACSVLKA